MKQSQACKRRVVLIVEDEPLVRLVGADVLSDAGFDVIEAANAQEALEVLYTCPDVRVVFTDVEMPGSLDGVGLAWRIRELWPHIGVLITSGRWRPMAATIPQEDHFVAKPYSAAVLVDNVAACMQRAQ